MEITNDLNILEAVKSQSIVNDLGYLAYQKRNGFIFKNHFSIHVIYAVINLEIGSKFRNKFQTKNLVYQQKILL